MTDNNKNYELLLKNVLEEYLIEEVDKHLDSFEYLEEPEYSEKHKKFIEDFFKQEKIEGKVIGKKEVA